MYAHVHGQTPSLIERAGAGLAPFQSVVDRALAKHPDDRFPSAGDLGRAALAALDSEAPTAPERVVGVGEAAPAPATTPLPTEVMMARPRSWPPRLAKAAVLVLLFALGVGTMLAIDPFDQEPSAVEASEGPASLEPAVGTDSTSESAEPSTPPVNPEPQGPLLTTGIGPVEIGTPAKRIERLFGFPDDQQAITGFGDEAANEATQVNWIYKYPDGKLYLYLDARSNRFNSYYTDSAKLTTSSGVAVGDSIAPLRDRYGADLADYPIGDGTLILSEGKTGTFPAILFGTEGDQITAITGGAAPLIGE